MSRAFPEVDSVLDRARDTLEIYDFLLSHVISLSCDSMRGWPIGLLYFLHQFPSPITSFHRSMAYGLWFFTIVEPTNQPSPTYQGLYLLSLSSISAIACNYCSYFYISLSTVLFFYLQEITPVPIRQRTTMLRTTSIRSSSHLLRRSIATQAAPKAEVTALSNGIVVATKHNPHSLTSSVGVVFGSGSTAENPYNNGVSNVWSNVFTGKQTAAEAAKKGFSLSSTVGRDFQSYIVDSKPGSASSALEFLQSKFSAPLNDSIFEETKNSVLSQVSNFEHNDHAGRVMEHLHSTAFQNTPLSLPTRGTVESIETLVPSDLQSFASNHFLASNAVVVGSGNISHQELVKAAESQISLKSGAKPVQKKQSSFLGSEVRLRDDTLPKAWISIAAEGEKITSPHYMTSLLAAQVFGSYNASEPASRLQGVKLLDILQEYQITDSFDHFSLGYKDSGLWGFTTTTSAVGSIDDLIHFTLKQWNRLTISVTDTEIARAKALLKLKLASAATDNASVATHLGAATLAQVEKTDLAEAYAAIDALTAKDVKQWAGDKLWDQDIAIAGVGQIEGLLDYMRIRADMSMMRW